jgi:hypothetical protein
VMFQVVAFPSSLALSSIEQIFSLDRSRCPPKAERSISVRRGIFAKELRLDVEGYIRN